MSIFHHYTIDMLHPRVTAPEAPQSKLRAKQEIQAAGLPGIPEGRRSTYE